MIGQIELQEKINRLIQNGFPRFTIITGQKGQGKKYIAKYIANKLKYNIIQLQDLKIDTIREIIELAYKQTEPIIYILADADNMSIGAKNSLLKLLEEPPQQAYFIMTLQDINNTLSTIKSRCRELKMDNYTVEDIENFINEINPNISELEKCILLDSCTNKYQIELFIKYGIQDFYNYVEKVVDNIAKVQSANSFKLAEKLDTKQDGNGYDIELFLNLFRMICSDRIMIQLNEENCEQLPLMSKAIQITSKIMQKLNINGINRQLLLDLWILRIREIWRN